MGSSVRAVQRGRLQAETEAEAGGQSWSAHSAGYARGYVTKWMSGVWRRRLFSLSASNSASALR